MESPVCPPKLAAPIFHAVEDGLHLLVHPVRPAWLVLNDSAYEIARLCDGRRSPAQIADCLASGYNLNPSLALRHVEQHLHSLDDKGWLFSPPVAPVSEFLKLNSLYIQITERCNLRCRHCFAWNGDQGVAELPFEQIKNLVDEAEALKGRFLTLSGGEPLLHPQFKQIIAYAAGKIKLQVLSNGTLIDRPTAELLGAARAVVQVSLDGADAAAHDRQRGAGAFEKTLRGIRLLAEAGVRVLICTVVTRDIAENHERVVRLAQSCHGAALRFIPLRCAGRARGNWEQLQADYRSYIEFYRRRVLAEPGEFAVSCGLSGLVLSSPPDTPAWCPVGRSLIVNVRGDVCPCVLLSDEEHRLGHIERQSLAEMLASEKILRLQEIRDRRRHDIAECAGCPWRNLCQGGCMGLAYTQRGSVWKTDEFCSLRRELYPQLIFSLARRKAARANLEPGIAA